MLSPSRSGVISFGSFQLDPDTGSLEKHGIRVRLSRQPARILKILAQRAGEVVTREELRAELWGSDTFVDFEHGLNAAINKLRQVLGDSPEKPRFIETLPGQGYRFLAAVRVEAPEPARDLTAPAIQATPPSPKMRRSQLFLACAGLSLVFLAAGWFLGRRDPPVHPPLAAKFVISPPNGSVIQPAGERQTFAVSPDGSRVAFTTIGEDGLNRLWIRPLTSLEAQEAPSARGAQTLFWSPAGDALYFSVDRSLRRITDPGSPYQLISDFPRRVPPLGAWIGPDQILLSHRQLTAVVPAGGGRPTELRDSYLWPQVLPDKRLLYVAYDKRIERFRLRAGRFGEPQAAKDIIETDSRVAWVASTRTPGTSYLLYVRGGSLLAQSFDLERLQATGDAVPLATSLHVFQPTAAADFSVSTNGVLVYQPLRKNARVVWVDRAGRELEQVGPDGQAVAYVRASPDGRKVAVSVHNPEKGAAEIWVYDSRSKVNRVVAAGPGIVDKPVWSPDGTRLLYSRGLGAGPRLYVRGLGEQDREEALPAAADLQLPSDWSRDGRFALFHSENVTDGDVGVLDWQTRKITWILDSPSNETAAVFSPEGDQVAFISNESGRSEVYVQAFDAQGRPRLTGDRVRISTDGAVLVRWRADGREICYMGADGVIYGVPVSTHPQFRAGTPAHLFRISIAARAALATAFGFDVSADGKKFLVPAVQEPATSQLVVMLGWESLLKRTGTDSARH
jgi:Tol biopolymer transport system component/DNA-binding winged helix-turn-helix (wHTH) protein